MSVKITDRTMEFIRKHENAADTVINTMAVDIERLAKMTVPFKKGHLRASIRHIKRGSMRYAVIANKVYAAFQEFGGDDKRVVRNYSKPGTGKGYLTKSGEYVGKSFGRRIKAIKQLI